VTRKRLSPYHRGLDNRGKRREEEVESKRKKTGAREDL